jgi:hypothetical protein
MDSFNESGSIFSDITNTFNYVIEHYEKFVLLLFVFIIIYFVDYITYINAILYTPPGLPTPHGLPILKPDIKKKSKRRRI